MDTHVQDGGVRDAYCRMFYASFCAFDRLLFSQLYVYFLKRSIHLWTTDDSRRITRNHNNSIPYKYKSQYTLRDDMTEPTKSINDPCLRRSR